MGPIKEILAETQFQEELTSSSQTKLVIVDFTASWCGPCQTIAPFYEQLSRKYPNAVFLKVDVDKCQETAVNQRVSVMPTFHFYRNKVKVDSMQGADRQKLEEMIQKYYDDGTAEDVGVAGHVRSSKRPNHTKSKQPSPDKSNSKSSAGQKKITNDVKKSWRHKDKKEKEREAKPEMELEASRVMSSHRVDQPTNKRTSFKEGAKKFFGRGSHEPEAKEGDPASPPVNRQSFKSIMDKVFHHHQDKTEKEARPSATGADKELSDESKNSPFLKEQTKPKKKKQK